MHGDALSADLPRADLVASVAALHHMDAVAGLTRLRDLVRPGGTLVVVGCELLPGIRYHRHVLWRYSLIWHRPTSAS